MNVELLFKYHYRPLCLYALHYLQNVEAAEDAVQDAFVRMIEKEQQGLQVEHAKSYLYTSVRNLCIDRLRKVSPEVPLSGPQDLDGLISDTEAQERSLHEARLWTAIGTLPARCREVFLLSKRDGKKYREIAQELGISERTVEHQVSKALRVLRGKIDEFFYLLCSLA